MVEKIWGMNFKSIIKNTSNLFKIEGFVDRFRINTSIFYYILNHYGGFQITPNKGYLKSFPDIPPQIKFLTRNEPIKSLSGFLNWVQPFLACIYFLGRAIWPESGRPERGDLIKVPLKSVQ